MDKFEESFIPRITQSFHNYNESDHTEVIDKHRNEKEIKALRKALGFISNKQTIVNVLCPKTNQQRVELAKAYHSMYDRDLIDDIKRKFSPKSHFTQLMVALLTPIHDFYCAELYGALEAGINDDCLIQILCTLCNHDMNEVCQRYVQIYGKTLEKDIRSGKLKINSINPLT
jgi:annexin A7/11